MGIYSPYCLLWKQLIWGEEGRGVALRPVSVFRTQNCNHVKKNVIYQLKSSQRDRQQDDISYNNNDNNNNGGVLQRPFLN